ncbi:MULTISPECIES: pyridoxamine 5'-phosphate oxidase family protein [Microbacterium]|uniref:pyridoxamine 5'-phosphate oxidase family protein n=1 Tax=Microbacterium TaxID=33882 RepID=UPI00146C5492|nr:MULTISPECIES: pyridoxamine 5'-phosphate oxidase family protein [Microbacterium]
MSFVFDPADKAHARTLARLESEQVAWIGTNGRDGYPHAVPVWFLWLGDRAIVLSEPATVKVRNLQADPKVLLHLEAGPDGEQLSVLRGTTTLFPGAGPAWRERIGAEYDAKYGEWMLRLGLPGEAMFARYSTVIEITPVTLIAW